jgi:hypothetical protein
LAHVGFTRAEINTRTSFGAMLGEAMAADQKMSIDAADLRVSSGVSSTHPGVQWLLGPQHVCDGLTKKIGMSNGVWQAVLQTARWLFMVASAVSTERVHMKQRRLESKAARVQSLEGGA